MARKKSRAQDYEFFAVDGQPGSTALVIDEKVAKNQYLEILYHQTKQKNSLLGSFDKSRKYSITDPKILEGLLLIPKKFEEKRDNVVYVSAQKDNFVLNFKIVFDLNVDFSSATLYLIEIEHGVEQDVKHITELDHFLNIHSATFIDEVFNAWKVWKEEEIYEKNDWLFDYLKLQHEEFLFNIELTEILAQLYLVRIIKILETSGELGQKLLFEYKLMVEARQEKDPAFKQSNINLKEILDYLLLKHDAVDEVLKVQGAAAVLYGYAEPLRRIKENVPSVAKEINQNQIKEEKVAKKTEVKKSKSKAKSKSSSPKLYKFDAGKAFKAVSVGSFTIPKYFTASKEKAPAKSTENAAPKIQIKNEKENIEKISIIQVKTEPVKQRDPFVAISSLRASVGGVTEKLNRSIAEQTLEK